METNKILQADVLDIIFDGKNKQYGAYDLRKSYSKRVKKSLLITGTVALLLFFSSVFANMVGKGRQETIDVVDMELGHIKPPPPAVVPPPPPPPPPQAPPPPPLNTIKFVPPVIVPDKDVDPNEKIKDIQDDQAISTITQKSDNTNNIVQAPIEDPNSGVVTVPKKTDDENTVFVKVEKEAEFDGDWGNFLKRNLNPEVPSDNGAPESTYTVMVKFVVSKDGSVSEITCENDPGYGICQEAIRVIKKAKKWIPALQNGNYVNAYRRQPITFVVRSSE
ncbi:MAG: energy transducer TonB [Ferruginibacter sp.]